MEIQKNYILEYLDLFKRSIRIHNRIALFSFIYILVNLLFITEPNFQRNKKRFFISKDISTLQSQISNAKEDSIELQVKFQKKKVEITTLTKKIKEAKDLESILVIFAFLNAEWEHASLYLSLLIFLYVTYLLVRRVRLLRILSKYLRISSEKYGPNESREFGINGSFLLAPVPKTGFEFLNKNDVVESLGWKHNHKTISLITGAGLIILLFIQMWLLYQESFISQSANTLHAFISSILTISTGLLVYIWFWGRFLLDSYNTDDKNISLLTKRDFVKMSGIAAVFLAFPVTYNFIGVVKKKVDKLIAFKPRFKIRSDNPVKSKLARVEEMVSTMLIENQSEKASIYLFSEIKAEVIDQKNFNRNSQHIFRLVDFLHKILLVQIHRDDSQSSMKMKEKLVQLIREADPENFRLSLWHSKDYKWEQVVKDKMNIIKWNKIEIT